MRRQSLLALALVALLGPRPGVAAMGDNSVGMNTHIPANDVIDACVDLGVYWVRMDCNWFEHQTTSGSPTFRAYLDDAITYAVAGGLDVFLTIAYTPGWASTGDTDGTNHNDVPAASTYDAFLRQAVAHYRGLGVTHFGLWNEPNLDGFWEGDANQYVDLIVGPGLTAVDLGCSDAGHLDCVSLGPELAHVGDVDVWLDDIMRRMDTSGLSFDIYSHHIYQGFPETGVAIWDGDRFFNALDSRRFVFTRRSFMDVMSETGHVTVGVPDREVWITETGYHNRPPMDAGEQDTQETYYMRVIDEQLARAWYTNTFFYEILDSLDELDGFGIIRRTSGPDSTWSDNFDLKDAFIALRNRIDTEPALQPTPCAYQCCDGIDNDGDTLADMADPGCESDEDDDESDEVVPPRSLLEAARSDAVTIDGSLDEWTGASFITLAAPDDFVSPDHPPSDASDISCRFSAMWSADSLYLAVEVTDDVHDNDQPATTIWAADSVQAALDMALNGGFGYDGTDDFELGWARTDSGDVARRWEAPSSAPPDSSVISTQATGTGMVYEVRIPATDLNESSLAEGAEYGFTLLVNDADGAGREGWIEWTPGIGAFKDPGSFGLLRLVDVPSPDPDGVEVPPELPDEPFPDSPDGSTDAPADDGTDPDWPGTGGGGCGCVIAS